jgi:hypothetical protein
MKCPTLDVAVVVRTAGERTREACLELVRQQVGAASVQVVSERPFELALRKSYETGIDQGRKWTMTLDADVLLREGAVRRLVAEAEAMPAGFVQIEGQVYDKISGSFREAGQRVYRTALLPLALEQIPAAGADIRPEYATLLKLGALGHRSRRVAIVMGVHDHEQYFRDLYRKAFIHATKHDFLLTKMVRRCRNLMASDADFRVVLRGLWDGLLHTGPIHLDTATFPADLAGVLGEMNVLEKGGLDDGAITSVTVEKWLASAGPVPHFLEWSRIGPAAPAGLGSQLARLWRQYGILGTLLQLSGAGLCRAGARVKSLAARSWQRSNKVKRDGPT